MYVNGYCQQPLSSAAQAMSALIQVWVWVGCVLWAVPSGGQTRSDTTDQSLANNSLGLEEMEILITLCLSSVCPQIVCPRGCTFTPDAFVPRCGCVTEAFVPSLGQPRSDRQWWEDLGWIRPWSDNEEGRGGLQ